ncbi:uncharacterized protein DUF3300 [Paraburkholderia sp. BL23I1N1]|uniref:DUF3300 domain-containing protein n=1 Tax=Paraburkholderia sp. BL23I1N1 TaxID=1938802 RepID=UPI000E707FD8|nr:DUF3300 domain-containing protein [Paraburkholderia sp. BL23I1N1]RKE39436.1 uncharacterized protein DUF3300 [Paraburkholderia sp. BL23I1N1]
MLIAAAYAGRIVAWGGRAILTACAILALNTVTSTDSLTFAQTPLPSVPAAPKLDAQQLDVLTAPIAAYPDPLLAQVLMATTFPDDVVAAAAWSESHPDLKGDDAVKAAASMPWDPSVQSLLAFPQALATMAQNPNWVEAIGQAFLTQPSDVMDSVQRLRQAAYKAGNLKATPQQTVVVQPATNTIVIQPVNPQVVYVPAYNPTIFYGPWPYPAYPPTYLPPPPGYVVGNALAAGMAFGAGIAITNALWGGCDWGRRDVNVNVNRYNNINVNRRIDASRTTSGWDRTNAINNRNRMQATGNRPGNINGRPTVPGAAADRSAYRGRENAQRAQASQTLSQRTGQSMSGSASERVNSMRQGGVAGGNAATARSRGAGAGGREEAARSNAAATVNRADVQNRAQNVNRDNALRDAGNANGGRQNIDRGLQSRNAANANPGGAVNTARQGNARDGAGAGAANSSRGGSGRAAGGGAGGGARGGGGGLRRP